jgi:CheY-like chemotaxis protein
MSASGVTGNVLPSDLAKFISSGVNKVLTKPLTKEKLMDTLASFQ